MGYYLYDSEQNAVLRQNIELSRERFAACKEKNFFFVVSNSHKVIVEAPNGDMIRLNDVTIEQAVILFATLLGLREAARE